MAKTAMVKRLAKERNILVREAEQWLDADAYLKEQHQWAQGRLHHEFLIQQMFVHGTATGQSKHNHTICWDRREPLSKWGLGVETTAMELIPPDSSQEDIADLYWDVYQLHRLPQRCQFKEGIEELIHQEILESKNASGLSGCLHCQRQSRDGGWVMLLGLTPMLSSLSQTMPHMRGLLPWSKTHVRKHWPWWGMPTDGP